jgi:tetratricopeptide (TPR) repeat protein
MARGAAPGGGGGESPGVTRPSPEPRIVFLEVPESLRGRIEALPGRAAEGDAGEDPAPEGGDAHETGDAGFAIDPASPLPVEIPEGEAALDLEQLSWEMILSGMIRVIAADPEGEHAGYYRNFVLAIRPEILREFTGAAIVKAENGDYDMALEILAGLGGLFPGSPAVLLNRALVLENRARARAEALERSGREGEAEALYGEVREAWEEVLARRPAPPGALFNAGFFFMGRGDFDRARECFSAYLPRAEDDEKKEKAEAFLREIRRGSLDDEGFREALALIRGAREQEGLLKIRDFLERKPEVWNGWFVLGWALRRLGRWSDGAASFRKALELGGDNPDTRNELAICLTELGDLGAARRELETALREEPENIKIISNLGALALKNGDTAAAAGFFRTVLELDPEDPVAREFLG